jgi:hypothetical protein
MSDIELTGPVLPKHAEDAMNRASHDPLAEYIPGHYRRIANDPQACLAMAAEELDSAAVGDLKAKDVAVRVANVWIRLAEASARINPGR